MQRLEDSTSRFREFFERVSPQFDQTVHPYAARRRGEALGAHARGEILEIGCGSGAVTKFLVSKGEVVSGDIAWGMVNVTRNAAGTKGVVFDGGVLPFRDRSLDTVVCAEAIYYLENPLGLIQEAWRVLRSGGILAVSCMTGFWQRVDRMRIWLANHGMRIGSEVPPVMKVLPQRRVRAEMERVGFSLKGDSPLIVLPDERFDGLNRRLERSPLGRGAVFWVLTGEKQ